MGLFRSRPDRVDHTVAPHEPGAHARAQAEREQRIAKVDAKLAVAAMIRPRGADTRRRFDDLLDERHRIRPARPLPRPSVPVVPGRQS